MMIKRSKQRPIIFQVVSTKASFLCFTAKITLNGAKPICLLAVVKNEKRDSFAKQEWGTLFFVNKIVDSSQQLDLSSVTGTTTRTTTRKTSVCSEVIEAVLKVQHVTFAAS